MQNKFSVMILATTLPLLTCNLAGAKENEASTRWSARVGVLGAYIPDYEGSNSYEWRAIPDLDITYGDHFFIDRRGAGINLLTTETLTTGVSLGYDAGRDESDNRQVLRGMGDVGETAIGSLFTSYTLGRLSLSASVGTDILGEGHDGTTIGLSANYRLPLGEKLILFAGPSVTWASDDYMQSLFGVTAAQAARSGRSPYRARSGFKDAGLTLFGAYRLTDSWAVTGVAGYKRLLGDAADSPLVAGDGDADQFIGGLGLSYHF